MRFTIVILVALLCFKALAADEKVSDDAIVQAAEKLVKENAPEATKAPMTAATAASVTAPTASVPATPVVAATPTTPTATVPESKESEIPLFLDSKKGDHGVGQMAWRLIASLVLIAVVGGGMVYAGKRWSRTRDKGGSRARIEMMHQFHMGPRKSLALIRVAGEVMLIGVTDHNINMIKSVALIDDELEGVMNKDFNNFLEDEFSIEDVRSALNTRN